MNAQLIMVAAAHVALVAATLYAAVFFALQGIRADKEHKARLAAQAARMASPEYAAANAAAAEAWSRHINGDVGGFAAWKAACRTLHTLNRY